MTAAEAIDLGFDLVWKSSLRTAISGSIRRYLRPTNSFREDITINVLEQDFDQLQSGILNINLFVPNPEYDATIDGKVVRLRDIPDHTRVKVLAALCNVIFKSVYNKDKRALLELSNQIILTDKEQTVINNRIRLTIKNF